MRQEHASLPSATRTRYWPSKSEWAAYGCTLVIAVGLPLWDAVRNRSPDMHPLQADRLWLRVVGIFFVGLNLAIAAAVAVRLGRLANRQRKGLCLACGYDLRSSTDRCPECGRGIEHRDAGAQHEVLTTGQVRGLNILAALDSWWMNLLWAIACGAGAIFTASRGARVIFAVVGMWFVYDVIRRARRLFKLR